jgi:hypothetical protein
MADEVHLKVDGLSTFARQCRRIGKEAQAQLRETNLHAAQMVVPEAQRRAPKGPHEGGPKGRPVQPITTSIRATAGQRFAAVRAGSKRSPHAAPIEFGGVIARRGYAGLSRSERKAGVRFTAGGERIRSRRFQKGEVRRQVAMTKIPARPYVWPAVDAMRSRINDVYGQDFRKLIRQAFPF